MAQAKEVNEISVDMYKLHMVDYYDLKSKCKLKNSVSYKNLMKLNWRNAQLNVELNFMQWFDHAPHWLRPFKSLKMGGGQPHFSHARWTI